MLPSMPSLAWTVLARLLAASAVGPYQRKPQ
jgi:hypothetical protein